MFGEKWLSMTVINTLSVIEDLRQLYQKYFS